MSYVPHEVRQFFSNRRFNKTQEAKTMLTLLSSAEPSEEPPGTGTRHQAWVAVGLYMAVLILQSPFAYGADTSTATIAHIVRTSMSQNHLKAAIVQVRLDGRNIYTGAFGDSMTVGTSKPMQFAPGTNWAYSHTNYVILGLVLAKIARMPLADALRRYVLQPMGLKQTYAFTTPWIPHPVLHAFTSERRQVLAVNPNVPFYEEATFWNPSWTTVQGAIEVTDISDLNTSMEAVSSGRFRSRRYFAVAKAQHCC
jgi:hypothetical protein